MANDKPKDTKSTKERRLKGKPRVTWVGTSLSKALDKEKVERDLDIELSVVKGYCINYEKEARIPEQHFKAKSPKL